MRNVVIRLLVPLAIGLVLGCGDHSDDSNPMIVSAARFVTEPPEVVIIGDSITAMDGYVELVQAELSIRKVWRSGRPGYTTRHWIPGWGFYQRHEFAELQPRVVVVLLGSNDASVFYRIPVDEYIENLEMIVDALFEDGVETVLLMTAPRLFTRPRVFTLAPPTEVLDRLEQYAYALSWFCAPPDDGIECGPDLFTMLEEPDFEDGLHPNAMGHERIADALLPFLAEPE